ncbi:MAG: ABC transporter substrate-binding protein [Salaquimonas sp.]|nr:ABC transporter substrate-binding protein [Salaquimonas sp.]
MSRMIACTIRGVVVGLLGAFCVTILAASGAFAGEAPELAKLVSEGKLPPLEQRLPKNPRVIDLPDEGKMVGKYGGDLHMLMGSVKDIGQITVYEYARLVGYDQNIELKPDLLESVDVVDGRQFTFKIREGHKWSDGHPFTAEDFRYYWEDMVKNPDLGREGVPSEMLVDGEEPKFEVIDPLTIRYTWSKPNPAFLQALAWPSPLYIYRPAHYMKQFHAKYADPAKLKEMVEDAGLDNWTALHTRMQRQRRPENPDLPTLQPWINTTQSPSERFIFERNPYFHRVDNEGNQLPYIDRLVMDVVSKDVIPAKTGGGESDLQARYIRFDNFTFLKEAEEKHGFKTYLWSTGKGSQVALFPNLNVQDTVWRGLMRDVRFRRALSLGIDREEINEVIYFGLATPSANTVMPQSPLFKEAYKDAWTQYDPDTANKLLDEAGLAARDDDGIRLLPNGQRAEITVETAGESTEETDVLELIADHWKKIGIKMFVRSSQRDIFRRRAQNGETQMSVFSGMDNAIAASDMSPQELAPTSQAQLQWPKWGEYFESGGVSGEPPDMPEAAAQIDRFKAWLEATTQDERRNIWADMLSTYTDQVFTIGTVNNTRQPVVVSDKLRNVPEEAIYTWEPTAFFGAYRPDTFWLDR